ncbi:FGGY family carbohydrate kinase [Azospirillum sp. ST 5-10]|uniref:FGGY family carbohydrate kinase n=1 Tax=unclassified Azospirillum TaxID=2630922 RepID=UPI003F4A570C
MLAVDQGTTNSKAVLIAESGAILATGSSPVEIRHPRSGWVEQDAGQIWTSIVAAIRACLDGAAGAGIAAIGISNQRESVLAWDRRTGTPLGPVVTWQCRRTAPACAALKAAGEEDGIIARTGLPLDPLFPATKARWLLDNHCQGRAPADVCLGTVDSWLIWNLTGGAIHATDSSNAARTQLYDIGRGRWDDALREVFGVPREVLPEVRDSSHVFGVTRGVPGVPDGVPVAAAIGDSHAALFGHGAFAAGDGKVTFGTGSSVMTTLRDFVVPPKGITTTIAWSLGGRPTYAFEGNILVSASILPWTAELLGVDGVAALLDLARSVDDAGGVYLVPAHVGLGSPHWNASARGLVCGLSFASTRAHVARAAAESIALQVQDVFEIVQANAGHPIGHLFVDGGPSRNPFLMGMVADVIGHPVVTCESTEASARGAAYLAGIAVGFWPDLATVGALERHGATLAPAIDPEVRATLLAGWRAAVARSTLGPG